MLAPNSAIVTHNQTLQSSSLVVTPSVKFGEFAPRENNPLMVATPP